MWWIVCLFLFLPGSVISRPRCGGVHTAARGIIQTPNFPNKFQIPIHCEWIIDAQNLATINSSIIIYFTQLYVFEGLTFKEYQIYDETYQLNGKEIHAVTESNVTKLSYIQSSQDYLVITLKLDTIESTHLRVLDHLLDVYGFNITYEITTSTPRTDRCTMMDCGFTGTCYDHYTRFSCDCFSGYEGPKCSKGPNSLCTGNTCKNGGICLHVGDSAVRCECGVAFTGEHCEQRIPVTPQQTQYLQQQRDCVDCFVSCPFDGKAENICKCAAGTNLTFVDGFIGYTAVFRFVNLPHMKPVQLKLQLETQISKLIHDVFPNIGEIQVAHIETFPSGIEVTCLMSGSKKEERRLRSVMSKWSDRGYIGNLTLAPRQDIVLNPRRGISTHQSITIHPSGIIHAGEDATLSCISRGTSLSFRWFKDGQFVNVTQPTSHKWTKVIEDTELRDQFTFQLGIKNASPLDQGTFTCQVIENGIQKCLSKRVDVKAPPRVWIEPMSLTVRKGENFTIKCFSMSNGYHKSKYTYSWTKNRELLPIKTETEHYEVLYPMGSILQVSTINKSTQFSCLVQDSAVWAEQGILVNVVDSEFVKTCSGERHLRLLWPETAPGTESIQECPVNYTGVARRACTLRDAAQPAWSMPDCSGCTANILLQVDTEKIRLGYQSKKPLHILDSYKQYLLKETQVLPGEGARILSLVNDVISYINDSISENITKTVFEIVDRILQQKYSVMNQTQVILLQQIVKRQSLLFQSTLQHQPLSRIDITLTPSDKTGFHVPLFTRSYPGWFSYKLHLALPAQLYSTTSANKSATLAVVVYRNLSAFLPQRSAIRLKDGIEVEYEIISNVAAAWLKYNGNEVAGNLLDNAFTMEFTHLAKNTSQDSWNVLCGIADFASFGYSWDPHVCITRLLNATTTRCICPRPGSYAVLLTMKPSYSENEVVPVRQLINLIGCATCSLLTAIAGLILFFYWLIRRSCLIFLKVQSCFSILGSMIVFIYALWDDVPNEFFLTVMSFLESFLLTGMSSQLSNLLIIYSELVHLPRVKSIKQTVVLIITGAPMIAVFGNHMAHVSMNTKIASWWLLQGSLSFNIFVTCCATIVIFYFVLYYIVIRKLTHINIKYEKTSEPLQNRIKLIHRSAFVFCAITGTVFSSILYINYVENVLYHYIFSSFSVIMGTVIFVCYILYSETPIKQLLITRLKEKNNEKPSPDGSNHLKFAVFTKQKPEVDNDSTPYFCKNGQETNFMHESISKQKLAEIECFQQYNSANFTHDGAHSSQQDLQYYESSPKQFQSPTYAREIINSPDLLGTKKFVDLDLVASSIQAHKTENTFFVSNLKIKPPCIMITQAETSFIDNINKSRSNNIELRQHPDGGEEKTIKEVIPMITIKETVSVSESNKDETNLDSVMDSITHDLDYLLNGNEFESDPNIPVVSVSTSVGGGLRRISKPPSISVFEQIAEEPEDELKLPEAITNVFRTNC